MNLKTILPYASDLITYSDSGEIDNVSDLSILFTMSDCKLYRGLKLPKESLIIGRVIEEWSGSTHWSKNEYIADVFTNSLDADDYILDYGKERGKNTITESLILFEKTILVIDSSVESLDLCRCLTLLKSAGYGQDIDYNYLKEEEVSIVGYDFIIKNIIFLNEQCYVYVEPIKNNK